MKPLSTPKRTLLAAAALSACALAPARADEAAMAAKIDQMQQQLDALKAELRQMKTQQAPAAPPQAAAAAGTQTPLPEQMAPTSTYATTAPSTSPLTVFGYGELNYEIYPRNRSQNQMDLARAVIGFGYRFDERTRLVAEFEWEHAVTSADDSGEAAVEQFYVERAFTPTLAGRAGLFLIPSGILNTAHEPTQFFGVTRNFVETAIIPTTWREAGIGLSGITSYDLSWDVGVTTGFNLSAWDPTSEDGKLSPLGSIHQEGQFAKAANLSGYGALNWRSMPGLLLGGSVFAGKAGQSQPNFPSDGAVVTLAEAHARYTTGPFDLSALYAYGHISDTAPYNLTIVGNPTLVPESFWGAYVQGAWYAWRSEDMQLAPFVRYERFNTGSSYADLPNGLTPSALRTEGVTTLGANFYLNSNIVFKANYQWFRTSNAYDRLQLGMGVNF